MFEVKSKTISVVIDATFKQSVSSGEIDVITMSKKFADDFSTYGLRSSHFFYNKTDSLYKFDFGFNLFKGNGRFRLNSDKLSFSFDGANSQSDLEAIAGCVASVFECNLPELSEVVLTVHDHAQFVKEADFDEFFKPRIKSGSLSVVSEGYLVNLVEPNTQKTFRLLVEQSVTEKGPFISWSIPLPNEFLNRSGLGKIEAGFEQSCEMIGLKFVK